MISSSNQPLGSPNVEEFSARCLLGLVIGSSETLKKPSILSFVRSKRFASSRLNKLATATGYQQALIRSKNFLLTLSHSAVNLSETFASVDGDSDFKTPANDPLTSALGLTEIFLATSSVMSIFIDAGLLCIVPSPSKGFTTISERKSHYRNCSLE
jgi:hypothetical protein